MRFLKKYIRKLYHLIWFLSALLIFSPRVYAIEENTNIGDTNFYTPSYATFGDVTNDYVTRYEGVSSHNVYYAPQNLVTNGANTDGMAIAFTHESLFIQGYYYNVTMLVGFSDASIYPKATSNRVCIGHNLSEVIDRYNANVACTSATVYSWDNVSSFTTYDGTQISLGMISYIFTSPATAKSFIGVMNSSFYRQGYQIFGGVLVEQLADNKTFSSLSAQDMHNILNNSGLASANSVSQVQQSITQIQTDINNSANNIINNNNQNTQDIINNNNQNTQEQIESQKVCKTITIDKNSIKEDNKYLDINGNFVNNNSWGVTGYVDVTHVKQLSNVNVNTSICFYNESKALISCSSNSSISNGTITLPTNTKYFRASIYKDQNIPTYEVETCKNGNQALDDSLNNIDDTLNNSSIDSSDSTLNSLNSQLPTNTVVSDLLLLPVRLLQSIVNSLGGTCSSFNLGSLYGTNLVMPCIDLESYLGSTIWTFIDLVFSGMFILVIRKKFIQIWENITNLKGGANEVD